jgi:RNA polymerase sigma-70 factor, ECF subfamily
MKLLRETSEVAPVNGCETWLPPEPFPASAMRELRRRIEEELPYLCRIARYWQREKAGAEDLVQDTVVRALAYAHLFTAGSNLRAWLLAIMRNVFLSAAAASARWVAMPDGLTADDREGAPHPSEGRLLLRDLERALRRLPQKQRAVVLAIGRDGKSYEEVARAMGTSVAAVRCHLGRARDRLRAAVNGDDDGVWFAARTERAPSPPPAAIRCSVGSPALVDAE